jgi:hypothetical protein
VLTSSFVLFEFFLLSFLFLSRHGRIAMFAFVGYIVHANGIKFPWPMQLDGTPFPTVSSAPEAWDSISDAAKWQIFAFIGFLEFVSLSGKTRIVACCHLFRLRGNFTHCLFASPDRCIKNCKFSFSLVP